MTSKQSVAYRLRSYTLSLLLKLRQLFRGKPIRVRLADSLLLLNVLLLRRVDPTRSFGDI